MMILLSGYAVMKKIFKLAPLSLLAVLLCCIAFFPVSAADESYSLADVTADMLTDIGGVPTFVIESENSVNIAGDGMEHNFALCVSSPSITLHLDDTNETSVLALEITGEIKITGGDLLIRNDGTALTVTDGSAWFTDCRVTAKSLKGNGALLHNSNIVFGSNGRLTITGANSGVVADGNSVINISNGGVFKAYSVHSFAVKLKDESSFLIEEGNQGKIFLGGHLRAVSGNIDISSDALIIGDPIRDASSFIITSGEKINITLDPGHGGRDPGAVYAAEKHPYGSAQYNFYLEKNLALTLGKYLKSYLEQSDYFNVALTRSDDSSLALIDRSKAAYENNADILISLHYNYDPSHTLGGSCAYVSQFDRYRLDGLAELIMEKLNKLGLKNLGALIRLDTDTDGDAPAWWDPYDNIRTDEVDTGIFCDYYGIVNGGGRMFSFPLLLEHLHLSNKNDMALIPDENGIAALARADADAMIAYFRCGDLLEDDTLYSFCHEFYERTKSLDDSFTSRDFVDSVSKYMTSLQDFSANDKFYECIRKSFLK